MRSMHPTRRRGRFSLFLSDPSRDGRARAPWRITSMVVASVLAVGGLVVADVVTAPEASAATINVPETGNVRAQMNGQVGHVTESGPANPVAGDEYRYGVSDNSTTSGQIDDTGGSAGTSGWPFYHSNGSTPWVTSNQTAWTAHGA